MCIRKFLYPAISKAPDCQSFPSSVCPSRRAMKLYAQRPLLTKAHCLSRCMCGTAPCCHMEHLHWCNPDQLCRWQAVAQVQAQLQADQMQQQQQQQQQPQGGQPNVSEGVPVGQNPATPGVDPPGFTYRNRSRRKASEKPVVSHSFLFSATCLSSGAPTENE